MRKFFCRIVFCLLLLCLNRLHAQDLRFTQVIKNTAAQISDIAQDKQGYLWIATRDQGLKRYDGINFKVYTNDPRNPNSLASGLPNRLFIDAENMIWIGMVGSGLEKFDPATNTFTHFKHDTKSTFSLSNDTVVSILEDHLGDLWVGTLGGLFLFGPIGFIVGPIVCGLFLTVWDIYGATFKEVLPPVKSFQTSDQNAIATTSRKSSRH